MTLPQSLLPQLNLQQLKEGREEGLEDSDRWTEKGRRWEGMNEGTKEWIIEGRRGIEEGQGGKDVPKETKSLFSPLIQQQQLDL